MIINEQGNKVIAASVVMGLVVVAGIGGWVLMNQNSDDTTRMESTAPTSSSNPASSSAAMANSYKNGIYEATGDYTSPGGAEQLGVEVTLTDGVISDVTVTPLATRPTSKIKQQDFADNYKVMVVGKNIDEVVLTKVSGSSLSPKGFNDAIEKIKSQAKS